MDKKIPIIWVESSKLTSSYYKEYLGFRIITWKYNHQGMDILLKKQNNLIWIKQLDIEKQKSIRIYQTQKITIFLSNFESEYNNLSQRVKLIKPIDKLKNKNTTFTIRECNGIDIVYTQS
ncbi:MAG: hypothetical protein HOO91_14095 [Bacteroidales bacterium]|nr:hypothetical protein [Bacteroidales bacterium]